MAGMFQCMDQRDTHPRLPWGFGRMLPGAMAGGKRAIAGHDTTRSPIQGLDPVKPRSRSNPNKAAFRFGGDEGGDRRPGVPRASPR